MVCSDGGGWGCDWKLGANPGGGFCFPGNGDRDDPSCEGGGAPGVNSPVVDLLQDFCRCWPVFANQVLCVERGGYRVKGVRSSRNDCWDRIVIERMGLGGERE